MSEKQYGHQIFAEVQILYPILKARKPKYGRSELSSLIAQHVPSLVHTPWFQAELLALVQQDTSWGHTQFIKPLFELIGRYFGIAVPGGCKTAPKGPNSDALADAVEERKAQIEADNEDFRLEMMAAEQQPLDD